MFEVPLFDVRIGEEEVEAVADAYRSGWLSSGPATEELESRFAAYTGAPHAVAVSSGTAALHLAMLVAGVAAGDRVAMPSMSFVATANAATYAGARPRFAEIAGVTRPWLSTEAAAEALDLGCSALATVSYGGRMGETAALADLAADRGVPLIEDAAHAGGSRLGDVHAGTFGTVGAFSFFANKNLGIGEGGMVVTADAALADRARSLRTHGMTTTSWERHRQRVSAYEIGELGFNYRIDEPRARLATMRLQKLDEENQARARIASEYASALQDLEGIEVLEPPAADERQSHHLFVVVLAAGANRDGFRRALAERGVETGVHYRAIHDFELYEDSELELPVTEDYAVRTVSLPLFPHMEQWQCELVIEAVHGAAGTG